MIEKAINRIVQLAVEAEPVEIVTVEGDPRKFTERPLVPVNPARPSELRISTLTGLIDWMQSEGAAIEDLLVHIAGPNRVNICSRLDSVWQDRNDYVEAVAKPCGFPFDQMIEIEKFIINLQLNFEETPEKAELLKFVSSISKNEVRAAEDDGISQTTIAKDEIGRLADVQLDPIQKLKPFRTFREVEQPVGEFLLRLSRGRGELPLVALYSAAGLAWELTAVESIFEHLSEALPKATIIR